MSFSVSVRDSNIEYCGKGLSGIFSNKSNLLNIKFLKMFFTIISFYKQSENQDPINENITLGSYLDNLKLSEYFIKFHIIPMVSAIWSMPPYEAKQMPLKFFFKFFQNHGLFKLKDRPQWFTVSKRSRTYVDKILSKISGEYYKNYNINKIKRIGSGVQVYYGDKNEYFTYDKVVLATHANQALSLIENPEEIENKILSNFKYKINEAIVHEDISYMPNNKSAWCSWNSSIESENSEKNSITYWLNLLQNLNINKNIFLTLNPYLEIPKEIK
jgi:Predicted NAD/FAD-binding protein